MIRTKVGPCEEEIRETIQRPQGEMLRLKNTPLGHHGPMSLALRKRSGTLWMAVAILLRHPSQRCGRTRRAVVLWMAFQRQASKLHQDACIGRSCRPTQQMTSPLAQCVVQNSRSWWRMGKKYALHTTLGRTYVMKTLSVVYAFILCFSKLANIDFRCI